MRETDVERAPDFRVIVLGSQGVQTLQVHPRGFVHDLFCETRAKTVVGELQDLECLHNRELVLVERLEHRGCSAGQERRLIRAPCPPDIGKRIDQVVGHNGSGHLLPLPQKVVCHHPIVAAQINRDDRSVIDVARAGEPLHDAVVNGPVRIEKQDPAFALPPVHDVLADEVFEEFRFAAPGRPHGVEMHAPLQGGEPELSPCPISSNQEIVTTGSRHKAQDRPVRGCVVEDD